MKRRLSQILIAAIYGLLISAFSFAIPPGSQRTWTTVEPGSLGDVNPFNGALNMGIPIMSIRGRGDTEIPLILHIGKSWRKFRYSWAGVPGTAERYTIQCAVIYLDGMTDRASCSGANNAPLPNLVEIYTKYFFSTFDSLDIGYAPAALVGASITTDVRACYAPPPNPGQAQYTPRASRFYLTFISPDGSSHELVDQATLGRFRVNTSSTCGQSSPDSLFSRGDTFISTDGTAMTFVSDSEVTYDFGGQGENGNDNYAGMSGVLYLPNGSQYRFDSGLISWIKDRNGNKTTFGYYPIVPNVDIWPKLHTITDSLGRTITIDYDIQDASPYGLCDHISYQGVGGENRVFRISKTNLSNVLRNGYAIQNTHDMWPVIDWRSSVDATPVNPVVTSALWLPDGRAYKFQYNSFVEAARVETPSGSAVEFDHDYAVGPLTGWHNYDQLPPARRATEKRVYSGANSQASLVTKTKFGSPRYDSSASLTDTVIVVDQTDANDNLLSRTKSFFYGDPGYFDYSRPASQTPPYYIDNWKNGREYETDYFESDGTTLFKRILKSWQNKVVPWLSQQDAAPTYDTRATSEAVITVEAGKALAVLSTTEYDENGSADPSYFCHLNIKRSKAYGYKALDFATAETASLATTVDMFNEVDPASISETDYSYDPNYKAHRMLGLPTETRVLNPTNTTDVLAKSQFAYDEPAYFDNNYTTTGWEDPGSNLRGNVTTIKTWVKETNTWIEAHKMYDNFGNVRRIWDTTGDPNCYIETQYSADYKYAYPTKTIAKGPDPTGIHGMSENSEVSRTYDLNTALVTSVTDANGQTTTTEYNDPLYRPTRIVPPSGAAITEINYNDTPGDIWVKARKQIDEQNWNEAQSYFDNLGRVTKVRRQDPQGDVFVESKYDDFGRLEGTTKPYRQGEQKLWSGVRYDASNRVVETYAPAPEGQTGVSLGTVEYGISDVTGFVGSYLTGTDASGRKARSIKNVFGQIIRVDEPTGNNDLGTLSSPNQPTFYKYDIRGNLTKVQQDQQNRYFMYDSFDHLIRVRQPEQTINPDLNTTGNPENNHWTAAFTYDVIGNLLTMTDAKGTVITNTYDNAGRVKRKTYSDGTPQVDYYYDGKGLPQIPQFSRGSLTKISSSVSENKYTSFDNFGKLLESQQLTTDEQRNGTQDPYTFRYKYDISGDLLEETYPSGRVVKNFVSSDGGLATVSSRKVNGDFKSYAANFDYAAAGNLRSMMLGNGKWETAQFNTRGQLTQLGLGNSANDTSLWKTQYEYGELNSDDTVDASKNIGIIAKQTTTIPTTNFVQTYQYDELNRLTEAKEKTGSTQNWRESFNYDRYGNRTGFYQITGSIELPINNVTKPNIDPATNRFTTGQGYVYDFNGNLVQDAEARTFTYDGNDKQIQVKDSNQAVVGTYLYDGEGQRVKKVTNDETTIFVYDASGDLAAEYSTHLSEQPTTSYLTTDHLGSPRVITDSRGEVVSRRDFMPFGEEIYSGVGPRTESLKYSLSGVDNVHQRFTSYQKDTETDLDFAEARMYQNQHGRFNTIDPLMASADPINPQTFNRYVYTGNNPVNYTDPSGLKWILSANGRYRWEDESYQLTKGETDITGKPITIGNCGPECRNNSVNEGDTVILTSDHRMQLVLSPEQAQQATSQAVQVTDESAEIVNTQNPSIGDHLNSAIATWNENNGLTALPVRQTDLGRLLGNLLSIGTGGGEAVVGIDMIAAGTVGTGVSSPACGSGAGCALPAASAAVAVGGLAITLHGAAVGLNTLYNVIIKGQPTSSGREYAPEDIERMKEGKPPKDENGNSMEVHHDGQSPDGELKGMTREEHRGKGNHAINHPDRGPSKLNSKIRRADRERYWKNEVKKLGLDK